MRSIALALALGVAVFACTKTVPCANGTLLLQIQLAGNAVSVKIEVAGHETSPLLTTVQPPDGSAGTVAIDFSNYPGGYSAVAGQTLPVKVTADYGNGMVVSNTVMVTFTSDCTVPPMPVNVTVGPPMAVTLNANPSTVVADGTKSTISVKVQDANGNAVPGAMVALSVLPCPNCAYNQPGMADSTGSASSTLSSKTADVETVKATVTKGDATVTSSTKVTFVAGAPDITTSSVKAMPSSVKADGSASTTIQVLVLDANMNAVQGKQVTLAIAPTSTADHLVQPSAATDGNGTASGSLTSSKAGAKTITATIDPGGANVMVTGNVTFTSGVPSSTKSTVVVNPLTPLTADGASAFAITATVEDANGNIIQGSHVTLQSTGNGNVFSPSGGTATTDGSGTAMLTIASTKAEPKTLTITADGVALSMMPTVTFIPGSPNPVRSTVTVNPTTTLTADGTTAFTVTITVLDVNSNAIPGSSITLQATGSNNLFSPSNAMASTDVNGGGTITIASTTAEAKTLTATADANLLTMMPSVTFTPGSPSASKSTASANPTSLRADGTSTSTITVAARDANNNLIQNASVTLQSSGSNNTIVPSSKMTTTNGSGVATFTISSTSAETKTITITIGSTVLTTKPTVLFMPLTCVWDVDTWDDGCQIGP